MKFLWTVLVVLLAGTLGACEQKTEEDCISEMNAELDSLAKIQEERRFSKDENEKITDEEWLRSKIAISDAQLAILGLGMDQYRDACDYYVFGSSVRAKNP
tara:strand:- start:364 stop:666 length:303 start_codon:yes stop_codon:yes gene_type:complete